MAELKLISPGTALPVPGVFTETDTARDILRCLRHVQANPGQDIGLVCGASGIGKTATIQHFAATSRDVHIHVAVADEGGTWNLANALCLQLGIVEPNGRKLDDSRWRIAERLRAGGMLIVDEAQYLVQRNSRGKDDWQAFEWLRAMSESWGVALVFVGDISLRAIETALPPLWSRASPKTIIRRPRTADLAQIGAQWGFVDAKSQALISAAARQGGALHTVKRLCRKAHTFAGDRIPTFDHLAAAAEFLNLLPGAK